LNDSQTVENSLCFTSEFILNLSTYELSPSDITLLNKGLSFIPTPKSIKISDIVTCRDRNLRNLKYKDYFQHKEDTYDPKDFTNLFKAPSTWEPKTRQLTAETVNCIQSINEFISDCCSSSCIPSSSVQTHTQGTHIPVSNRNDNLTKLERKSLYTLSRNRDIIIKQADKGGAVVLMDRILYEQEGFRQLYNTKYYKQIHNSTRHETASRISKIIQSLHARGIISRRQYQLLNPTVSEDTRSFYLLPKIHKSHHTWPHSNMPEGRPIVSDCGSETYFVSKFIDYFLKPFSSMNIGYIRDSYQFIDKIQDKIIPQTAYLVTGDVTALYTNMNINRSIQVVKDLFHEYPNALRPDSEIVELLEICLTTNEFQFAGQLFIQILGTAMGKAFAPNLANMYLRELDQKATSHDEYKIDLYSRFIDDIFFIWLSDLSKLREYEEYLNNLIPDIKISFKAQQQHIEFLDVLVYTSPVPGSLDHNILKTCTHFKSTDTHQLLHTRSFHPNHTTVGILKSQLIRFRRLSSTKSDYNKSCRILFRVLQRRGYKRSLFRKLKYKIWYHNASYSTQNTDPPIWPLINYFDDIGLNINKFMRQKISHLQCAQNKRLVFAFKKHRNLGAFLTRSKLD